MQRLVRPALAAGLVLAMLASSGLAFAAGFQGGRGFGPAGRRFSDLGGYGWAMSGITALRDQGVLNGVSASQFDPSGWTSRADMATVLGRMLGWQQSGSACTQQFGNLASIPGYARCDVGMATQQGIMQGMPGGNFMPQGNVTWAQLPVIMARALHYRPAPAGQISSLLSQIPQGSYTPSWAAPAVAEAIQAGDFTGLLADLYEPGQYVTRAELAAFLAQAEETMAGTTTTSSTAEVLTGQITAVSGPQLTLQTASGSQTLQMSPTATVYVGQSIGSTANVQSGDTVTVVVAGGEAVDVNITAGPTVSTSAGLGNTFQATVVSVTSTQLELQVPGVPSFYVPVAAGVSVGGIASGESVTVTVNSSGQATAISAGSSTSTGTTTVSGTVQTVSGNTLLLDVNGATQVYTLSAATTINGVANDLGALTSGEAVTVYATDGQATAIDTTSGTSATTVAGTIESVSGDSLILNVNGVTEGYTLSSATTVDGVVNDLGALAADQTVTLTVTGTLVSAVQITSSGATTTVTGTVLSLSGDTLLLSVSGTGEVFTLTSSTTVNGAVNNFGALSQGVTATVSEVGGQVTSVTTNGSGATTTVTGVVSTISGYTLTLSVYGTPEVYTLTGSTAVNGALNNIGTIVNGETVTLTLVNGTVTAVQLGQTSASTTNGATPYMASQ